jgi:hypothetical protein
MLNNIRFCCIIFSIIILFASQLQAQFDLDVETGVAFSGYNDVRIPGDGGTLFSFSEELDAESGIFFRLRVFYNFNERHHLIALYAPLTINSTGQLDRDLIFQEELFPVNTPLEATYTFNSYRFSYRYDFLRKDNIEIGAGFTAKVRDAKILVKGDGLESEKANVGFVPLIHFRLLWKLSHRVAFLLNGDALAAPQGRAEDVIAALIYKASDQIDLKAGYRILEGGADNDEVYNFTLIHYAAIGAIFHF